MLREDEAYRDVYLGGYKIDEECSGEILECLLSGYCPVCSGPIIDEEEIPQDFGSVGDTFEWGCIDCGIMVKVETTR